MDIMVKRAYFLLFVRIYNAYSLISSHEWAMRASPPHAFLVSAFTGPPLFWLLRKLGLNVSFIPMFFVEFVILGAFNFIHFDLDKNIDAKVTLAANELGESLLSKLFTFLLILLSFFIFYMGNF